jgi:hypothetical protein
MATSNVASIAFPNEESLPPWMISDAVSGGPGDDDLSDSMSRAERAIRLYRMWLTGALQQPGGPPIPLYWCARRVATFWIVAGLMRSLSHPVRGGIDVEETCRNPGSRLVWRCCTTITVGIPAKNRTPTERRTGSTHDHRDCNSRGHVT